ncbi:MAG: helix-turn-helix domain-containing protein [Clostridia bacterium]|nr:helix-turn-helix domain-containing protein [Clostridia bacterium]
METQTILKEHQKFNTIPIHIERFTPDKPVLLHYHDCGELVFCIGGHGITNIDKTCLKLKRNDLFVISGKQTHTMSDFNNFEAYRVLFDMSLLDALPEKTKNTLGFTSLFLISDSGYVNYNYRCCISMTGHYTDRLSLLMQELLFEYETSETSDEIYIRTLFCSICMLIIKCFESKPRKQAKTFFTKGIAELVKHLNESINISEVAHTLGISESYFRKVFTEQAGVSPAQFIADIRLRRAKSLLSCTDKPITEIAFSCGFYDSSHLTRVFKKYEGITPKEYRKRTRQ